MDHYTCCHYTWSFIGHSSSQVLDMVDPQIERKLIEIMRIIDENDKPIGARAIADELYSRGYNIGERAVRYHLSILDERGFTEKHGYSGRTITGKGKGELGEALIGDRLDFVITRIEDLIYRTDFDTLSGTGHVIVNISHIDKDDFDSCIDIMTRVASGGVGISPRLGIFEEGCDDVYVPPGKISIATVCSLTFDGILLKNGIPVRPSFGGILQMADGAPQRFLDLISYTGTSIDPIKIFMMRQATSVLDVLDSGNGTILANVRNIPVSSVERAQDIMELTAASDIGGLMMIGEPGYTMLGSPVETGMSGVLAYVGVNAIAAIEEAGIGVDTNPVSTIMRYEDMREV